eukprot:scaffold65874_cov46-Tisochrysis_lutea.AAC.1
MSEGRAARQEEGGGSGERERERERAWLQAIGSRPRGRARGERMLGIFFPLRHNTQSLVPRPRPTGKPANRRRLVLSSSPPV